MCGGRPSAPKVIYQGPSEAEQQAQREALAQTRLQMEQQNAAFQSQLDQQIAAANAAAAKAQTQLEAAQAAAAAPESAVIAATQPMTYAVTTTQSTAAENVKTTAPIVPEDPTKKAFKVSSGGSKTGAGAGLNVGI